MKNEHSAVALYARLGVKILHSSEAGLILEYTPSFTGFDTLRSRALLQNDKLVLLPRITGVRPVAAQVGAPQAMELRLPIAVPSVEGFRLGYVSVSGVRQIKQHIAPKPALRAETVRVTSASVTGIIERLETVPTPEYSINSALYEQSETLDWCSFEYAGIARDRHIATLMIRAARYDAASGAIQIPTKIRIHVLFTPENAASTPFTTQVRQQRANSLSNANLSAAVNYMQTAAWSVGENDIKDDIEHNGQSQTQFDKRDKAAAVQSAQGRWYKIAMNEEGVYRLDIQTLRNKGITIAPQEVATIRLFGNGGKQLSERVSESVRNVMNEQEILLDTSAGGQLNAIMFYGAAADGWAYENGEVRHFINTSTYKGAKERTNYYLLNIGGFSGGKRAEPASLAKAATLRPPYHTGRIFWEEEIINPYRSSGQRWYGNKLGSPWTQRTTLDNLMPIGDVLYRYAVGHYKNSGDIPQGTLTVKETGTTLSRIPLLSTGGYQVAYMTTQTARLPASSLVGNPSSLQFSYEGSDTDYGVVDWFEIHYPRSFTAINNKLDFFTETTGTVNLRADQSIVSEYNIGGFSSQPVYVVDATNPAQATFIKNEATVNNQASFKVEFTPESPRRLFVSSTVLTPSIEPTEDFADLRSVRAGADVIVVTHKDLLSSAQGYKQYREANSGVSVLVATTDEIYNEFAGGMPDPTAIRDFVAFAFRTWTTKPRYVVLWGNGHFNNRYIQMDATPATKNYVPTYQIYDRDGIADEVSGNYTTDDFFVRVQGDDPIVDLAIGRLPAIISNRGENGGAVFLEKIRRYENNATQGNSSQDAWRTRITLVADDSPTREGGDGTLHTRDSELLTESIPTYMRFRKIYMPDYPAEADIKSSVGGIKRPAVTADIINTVNAGTLLLNWVGHGAPQLWAHEQVFANDDIALFTNANRLFFLTAATCDYSRFDNPQSICGPVAMLRKSDGGAIGVFSATRVVYASQNAVISQQLYAKLFEVQRDGRTLTTGEAVFATKQILYDVNDQKFCLLGDPLIRLLIPQQRTAITRLGGIEMGGQANPQLKALQKVDVEGTVLQLSTITSPQARIDESFNGNVSLLLYDTDITRRPVDVDGTVHNFTILGGLLNAGAAPVKNGKFSASFVIPKDISFSNLAGNLFAYTFDSTRRKYGIGSTTNFRIGDLDESTVNDGAGPEVQLFLEDRTFRAGDYVSKNPLLIVDLFDATGLNATGSGIGRDIQCWIDNAAVPTNLTPSFAPSFEDARRGAAIRQLFNLSAGIHRIRVRAWDVFNNFSESETWFRVEQDGSKPTIVETMNYPNPFPLTTTVQFRHNQSSSTPVTMHIYTFNGMLLRSIETLTTGRTSEIQWDGLDANGQQLPTGLYLYRVVISDSNGGTASATNKMLLVR